MGRTIGIKVRQSGRNLTDFLKKVHEKDFSGILNMYGQKGVEALRAATPVDTGLTANSWYHEVEVLGEKTYIIRWLNSNVQRGINIALILDVGHGTGSGGWVEGLNYIEPSIRPLFEEIARDCWSEVTNA